MAFVSKFIKHPLAMVALHIVVLVIVFAYGLLVGRYKIFPYEQVVSLKEFVSPNPFATSTHAERRVQMFDVFGKDADLVFIGDSHTEFGMWSEYINSGTIATRTIATRTVATRTVATRTVATRTVANRGVHSDTTGNVLERMDSILSTNPGSAYVMLGVNDVFEGFSIEEIINNYREIVRILKSNNIEVIVQSTVQCHPHFCSQDKISQINTLNERLENLAKDEALDFLYLEGLSDQSGLTAELTYDGIHLTPAGYKLWLSRIAEHLGN